MGLFLEFLFLIFCLVRVSVSSVAQSCLTLWPHGLPHARLPSPSLSPGASSNSCPLSPWCYPTISSSATFFSFCLQSLPPSVSFPVSWLLASDAQIIEASMASVLPMSIQGWFPLGLTGLISLLSRELSTIFSSTTVWKHQLFALSLLYDPTLTSICNSWENHSFDYTDLCGQSNVYAV